MISRRVFAIFGQYRHLPLLVTERSGWTWAVKTDAESSLAAAACGALGCRDHTWHLHPATREPKATAAWRLTVAALTVLRLTVAASSCARRAAMSTGTHASRAARTAHASRVRPFGTWSLALSIDESSSVSSTDPDLPPPAPKRRRRVGSKAERLAGFAAAAKLPVSSTLPAADRIQAAYRGHRVRKQVRLLRPSSASSSEGGAIEVNDEVPEEILETEEVSKELADMRLSADSLEPLDSALESSSDLDQLNEMLAAVADQKHEHQQSTPPAPNVACAICLGPMQRRRRGSQPAEADPTALSLTVATLECSHSFHRRCLFGWCQQQPKGGCPLCRTEVRIKRTRNNTRPQQQPGRSGAASTSAEADD